MPQNRIPSLARACQILELFADADAPISSSEIARRLAVPRTTALRILLTLCEEDLLARTGNDFEPGSKLFRLGIRALSALRLRQFAAPILRALAARTGETAQLVTLTGAQALEAAPQGLVLDVCDGPRPIRVAQEPGALIALHASAAGKVLLAFALRPRRAPASASTPAVSSSAPTLDAHTPNTLTTVAELEAELDRITHLGYAVDDEEYYEGVRALAAPVWDASGGVRAAIGVIAAASTFTRRQNPDVAHHVLQAAAELSQAMGYAPAAVPLPSTR